jgi:hypothetical protein
MDAIEKDINETVTVRTSDGKTVKGKELEIYTGAGSKTSGNILKNSPFETSCYTGLSSKPDTYDGRAVEAIALKDVCKRDKDDGDFKTMYVDPASHDPVAVVGRGGEDPVFVSFEQRYVRAGAYVVPDLLAVRVKGSGLMFWLDFDFHAAFTDYSFSDKAP